MPGIDDPEAKSDEVGPDPIESLVVNVRRIGCEYPHPPKPLDQVRR